MRDKTWKDWIRSPLGVVILLGVVVLLSLSLGRMVSRYRAAMENKKFSTTEFETLQNQEAALYKKIEWLSTPEGIEYEIRDRYGVVKPGEEVIVITE